MKLEISPYTPYTLSLCHDGLADVINGSIFVIPGGCIGFPTFLWIHSGGPSKAHEICLELVWTPACAETTRFRWNHTQLTS